MEQMLAAQQQVKAYQTAMNEFLACIDSELEAEGEQAPEDFKSLMFSRHDAAVAEMEGVAAADAPGRIADRMESAFRSLGMPTRLSELGIARERLLQVLELSLRNFNADPKREFVRERELLGKILQSAW